MKGTEFSDELYDCNLLKFRFKTYLNRYNDIYNILPFQSALGECFGELAHKSPELQEEFLYNAETQRTLTKNGQILISALNFFVSSVNTLCNKTMEDTIATVKLYETAR